MCIGIIAMVESVSGHGFGLACFCFFFFFWLIAKLLDLTMRVVGSATANFDLHKLDFCKKKVADRQDFGEIQLFKGKICRKVLDISNVLP